MKPERVSELTDFITMLVQQYIEIHQNLNDTYTGISKQELNIVSTIGKASSPIIMREIAERVGLAISSVTPIVDKLVEKKLVHRERSTEDRRIVTAELSDRGAKIYQLEVDSYTRLSTLILQALTESEQEKFLGYFRKVASSLQTQNDS
jgi:DNA-binding MarR family transcriptional regulator